MALYSSAVHNTVLWREGKKGKAVLVASTPLPYSSARVRYHSFHALRLTFSGLDLPEFRRSFRACPASFIDEFVRINLISLSTTAVSNLGSAIDLIKMEKWKEKQRVAIPQQ